MEDIKQTKVGRMKYFASPTEIPALHYISHCEDPSTRKNDIPNMEYNRPVQDGEGIVVYVMENDYHDCNAGPLEFLNSKDVMPEEDIHGHGMLVLSLIRETARKCILVVVARKLFKDPSILLTKEPELRGKRDVHDWAGALHQVLLDVKRRRLKTAVMNLSAGFTRTNRRAFLLDELIKAGVVVVGAAGNDNVDLSTLTAGQRQLPEAKQGLIIVGCLDETGVRWERNHEEGSNYGHQVDYWVHAKRTSVNVPLMSRYPTGKREATGTSFACAITTGVVACLLSVQRADDKKKLTFLRDINHVSPFGRSTVCEILDTWAAKDGNGLKHLKNAPDLTLVPPPRRSDSTSAPDPSEQQAFGLRHPMVAKDEKKKRGEAFFKSLLRWNQ